jgi:hypothetical protein
MQFAYGSVAMKLPQNRYAIAMKLFVPLTDELLYSLAGPPAPLVPYRCGMLCRRGQESEPVDPIRPHDEPLFSVSPSIRLPA